jgi:hypothetical protein
MRSARSRLVRALGWSWMGMACAACVPWWCGCGTGMRLVLAGNGPGRDFLPAVLGWRLGPVPGHVACAGRDRRAGSRAVVAGGVSRRGCRCPACTAGGYLLACQDWG